LVSAAEISFLVNLHKFLEVFHTFNRLLKFWILCVKFLGFACQTTPMCRQKILHKIHIRKILFESFLHIQVVKGV